jgi:hypothetical protein
MSVPLPLKHRIKKNKILIIEGSSRITLTYVIKPFELSCQCQNSQRAPRDPVCHHLEYYLCKVMGLHRQYIHVLSIPRVRSRIQEIIAAEGKSALNHYCRRFLTDEEEDHCIICHDSYCLENHVQIDRLHQCPSCSELFHIKCYKQWLSSGHEASCPICKYVRVPGPGTRTNRTLPDIIWPVPPPPDGP